MAKQNKTPNKKSLEEIPVQNQATPSKPQPGTISASTITNFIKGKEIYFLMAAIALCCLIVFYDFISGEKVYLYKDIGSDSVNIYVPWMAQMSDYIKNYGVPSWSFSQGLGQNAFPLWLGDFFSNILMLFSKENIPYYIAFAEILKIFLCGFVFFKYLNELKLSRFASYLGGFLFAFCGYIILGSCWIIFSVEALYVALILYGFERWLNKGKLLWFVAGIGALSFLQPFLLFPHALFLAVYIPVRFNDVYGHEWKKFPLFIAKTIGLAILAVAISAYQLFPDLLQYIESPRVGGDARLIDTLKAQPIFSLADPVLRFTTTFRTFGSDMLGTGMEFKGWQNYLEAPLFYCGIFSLVAFPQAFVAFSKKQRIAYGILTALFVLPILFPYFRYSFWAYTGDYYRALSLVITIILLMFSARALDYILTTRKINLIVLGGTVAFLLILLFSPSKELEANINQGMRSTATLLVVIYAAVLWGLTRPGYIRNLAIAVLILFCFFEAVFYSTTTVNERDIVTTKELTEKVGYNDYTVDAVNYLKSHDKGFYRINKDYQSGPAIHASFNDAKAQGYFGTTSYHSFNQKNYIKFLGDLGVVDPKNELETRWVKGLAERPLLMSLTSGKYWMSKKPANQLKVFGYDSLAKFGDVYLYRNNYSIPLGIASDITLDEAAFKKLSQGQKDLFLFKGCVVSNDDNDLASYKKYNLADTALPTTLELYFQTAKAMASDSLAITEFKESNIKGNITTTSPKILFFTIPYDEGWKATVNGVDTKLYRVDLGLTGLKLPAGKSTIELHFEPRYRAKGAIVSLCSALVFIALIGVSSRKSRNEAV